MILRSIFLMMVLMQDVGSVENMAQSSIIRHLPAESLQSSSLEDGMQTKIYQMKVWHKTCADLLNVVVMVKTYLKTQAMAHVVLFSSDLELRYDQLIDYYHLRLQIEFNFRDAKQY